MMYKIVTKCLLEGTKVGNLQLVSPTDPNGREGGLYAQMYNSFLRHIPSIQIALLQSSHIKYSFVRSIKA